MTHQKDAVRSGYWPLYRFRPTAEEVGQPLTLDSREPSIPVADFVGSEVRFSALTRSHPDRARELMRLLERDAAERWRYYSQLAGVQRTLVSETADSDDEAAAEAPGGDGRVPGAAPAAPAPAGEVTP
jgi:pyruvate-ferredoxin/flavodoxin oxidoreductase